MMRQEQDAARRRANFFAGPDDRVSARLAADNYHGSDSFAALENELGPGATQLVARVGAALLPEIAHLNIPLGTAISQVLGKLTHAEKLSIASGTIPPSVTQTITAEVAAARDAQRQAILANERALLGAGQRSDGSYDPALAASFARGAFRGSGEGRLRSDGLSAASLSPGLGGSAAHYIGHPETVSLTNYAKTPYAATGMNHSTFQHLQQHRLPDGGRFSGQNIVHAGQDAVTQQFSPNNRRVTTNLAILDKYDPARRDERNKLLLDVRRTAEQDAELKRLAGEFANAKTPEDRARIKALADARGLQIQGQKGWLPHVATLPPQAKAAGFDQGKATIDDAFIKLIPDPKLRAEMQKQFELGQTNVGVAATPEAQQIWRETLLKAAGSDPAKLAAVDVITKRPEISQEPIERAVAAEAITRSEIAKIDAAEATIGQGLAALNTIKVQETTAKPADVAAPADKSPQPATATKSGEQPAAEKATVKATPPAPK